jgi:hypothetical protein
MNRRASPSSFARFSESATCKAAELLTHAIRSLLARISRLVCSMCSAAKIGCEGRSRLPSRPRSSMAAKPCCPAKSSIFFQSQRGQARVENASCNRGAFPARAIMGANAASPCRNCRRLLIIASELSPLHLLHSIITRSRR